ncbi:MAG: HAMP domain-containing sensor histidine kinase, partial [Bacteroidota bacterium]
NVNSLNTEKLLKNVQRIENNVDRLNHLINNILMIGKLDSDKIPFDPKPLNVSQYIIDSILPDFESRNQQILISVEEQEKEVSLDPRLFSHIVTNLLENAIKYSSASKLPEIKLRYHADRVEIRVIDYGIGIPKEDIPKLFDTFFRASNVDNIQGTGLGLSIVNQFVKIHNGTIKVESEVGKGSSFIVYFPYT